MSLETKKREYQRAFAKAEASLKSNEIETLSSETPSLNELRYSGQHFAHAIICELDNNIAEAESHIDQATRHCKRAFYDAKESLFLNLMKQIHDFQAEYKEIVVSDVINEFAGHRRKLKEIQKEYGEVVIKALERHNRDLYIDEIEKNIPAIEEILFDWENRRDELNRKKIEYYELKARIR